MTAAALKQRMLAADNAPVADKRASSQTVEIPAGKGEPAKTVVLQDEYAWLRGAKWPNETVDEPDIIKYLEAENDYCKDFLKSLEEHKDKFYETLKGRIKLTDKTVEAKRGDWLYYSRTEEALQYSIDCRRKADGSAAEEILLDRNKLAENQKFCKVLATNVSENHKLMAYRSDFVGDENYKLTFQKVGTGELLPESGELEQISTYCWHECANQAADPVGVFYSVRNAQLRPTKVYYHKFGTDVSADPLIFESQNEMYTVSVRPTEDLEYIMIDYHSKTENEVKYFSMADTLQKAQAAGTGMPLTADAFPLTTLRALQEDIEYSAEHGGGSWLLKTKEGCQHEHFRILRKRDGTDADFEVLLEEDSEFAISSSPAVTRSFFGVSYLSTKTGQPRLFVYKNDPSMAAAEVRAMRQQVYFPGVDPDLTSHNAAFSHTCNYEEDLICVAVDTPTAPTIWYKYPKFGAAAADLAVVKQKEVPNYEQELYATERVYVQYEENRSAALHPSAVAEAEAKEQQGSFTPATSKTPSIPVTMFYKKSLLKKDGSMPLLLNGYGSYGICEEPVWSNLCTLYADLGFVVATAHIRGGGDLGEPWYQAAKFLTKKRTFYDFIAVAEHLATSGWTSQGNVAIVGGSAGGMLVGACLNLKPSLFKAIVAHVPFVTVLDTMLDGSLPLTPGEFKEWGNPRDAGYFDYMRSYCPYENVDVKNTLLAANANGGKYPSIFATTGLTDYRVGYYEGAKWIARIRAQIKEAKEAKAAGEISEPLVLMETNMAAGHAGASGRFDRLKEVSRDVAFLATEFDLIK